MKYAILILVALGLSGFALSQSASTGSSDKLSKILNIAAENRFADLCKPGTERKSDQSTYIVERDPLLFPEEFSGGYITEHTVFGLWNAHFFEKKLIPGKATEKYNRLKSYFIGWEKTEDITLAEMEYDPDEFYFDESDYTSYYEYTFTKGNVKALISIEESGLQSSIWLTLSRVN